MNIKQKELVIKFRQDIERINRQRRIWLVLSSLVLVSIILIIFSWNFIQDAHIWWAVGSIGLVIAMNWWYWTMTLIRRLLCHQSHMVDVLEEISKEVNNIRSDIIVPISEKVDN